MTTVARLMVASGNLDGLVLTYSAAGLTYLWFNPPVVQAHLRFNSRASTMADKQCRLWAKVGKQGYL